MPGESQRPVGRAALLLLAGLVATILGVAVHQGRVTRLARSGGSSETAVWVTLSAGSPLSRSWGQFFACSGLNSDADIARATLMLNDQAEMPLWTAVARRAEDVRVQVALKPTSQVLSPRAAQVADSIVGERCQSEQ